MSKVTMLVFGFLFAAQLAVPATDAHAGPFIDWLLGRPIITYPSTPAVGVPAMATVQPVTANYPAVTSVVPQAAVTANYPTTGACCPTTAAYAPAATAPCCPTQGTPVTAYQIPAVVSQPVQGVDQMRPLTVGYSPTYRSSWYRVPVTYYRPVTTYPVAGAQPVTSMYPCNTYGYQVQRRPVLFGRPWLPALPATTVGTAYAPVVTQPLVTAAPAACPCGPTSGVAPAAATIPYIAPSSPPTITSPNDVVPGSSTPGLQPAAPAVGTGIEPADQAPTLQLDSAPATFPNSASSQSSPPMSASIQGHAPNTSSVYQVKPIPDPEAKVEPNSPRVLAPPLLNPRDRTASQTSARARMVTPAVYKTPAPAPAAQAPTKRNQLWNDQGWKTAGK